MKHFLLSSTKQIIKSVIYLMMGGLLALLTVFVLHLEKRPDLNIWHEAELDTEFTTKSRVVDFNWKKKYTPRLRRKTGII
jgi:hypothetical protein